MASKTTVANMALSHLGQGLSIGDLETEQSEAANSIRVFFDTALETILRKKDWAFARKTQALSLVASNPTTSWLYAFRYPTDCIMLRGDSSYGYYPATSYSPVGSVPYGRGADDGGGLIYSNSTSGLFTYTYRNDTVAFWPSDFQLAFSFLLASMIAPRLTAGDPFKLGDRAYAMYERTLETAAVNSYNEEAPVAQAQSAFQTVRY